MAKPTLDRDVQTDAILRSAPYLSGESFTSPVIASILNLTVAQSRDLLNHLTTTGQLVKRHERARQGGNRTGTMAYQRPPPMILRKAWRKLSDSAIGIQA
jgi:hypothetical protein